MNKLLVLLGAALVLAACATKAPNPYGTPFPINPTTSAGAGK
ncbi:lipoprotein [Paralysiella testudinis]|uniref:Type IV secretion system putative lipoprotein virB7 n=1 Tax=Paralysiella testudinis TaxID=2809020 RepID=A0A892ZMJ2_9NEIS|nr:lipoprotein [Paralysiella testudinis]QRQ82834.1 lipoprotein [Paralysiella testudinis]